MSEPLLQVTDLVKHFPIKSGVVVDREVGRVKAVDGVSLTIEEGETLGLVGESGCGKSTLCRVILQLTAPTSGSVRFDGEELVGRSRRQMRPIRRQIQMIFQDPYASLNPRKRVSQIIGEPMELHGLASGRDVGKRVQDLLDRVGLNAEHSDRYPHEFSGGQRQRIGIARALALRPKLIIADEPVSALDVSVQAQIINLLKDIQDEFRLSYLFVAHDLGVVRHVSDRVAVMYLGRIVESVDAAALHDRPLHPYSNALLSAVPIPDPRLNAARERLVLEGDVPSPIDPHRAATSTLAARGPPACATPTIPRFANWRPITSSPATIRATSKPRTSSALHRGTCVIGSPPEPRGNRRALSPRVVDPPRRGRLCPVGKRVGSILLPGVHNFLAGNLLEISVPFSSGRKLVLADNVKIE